MDHRFGIASRLGMMIDFSGTACHRSPGQADGGGIAYGRTRRVHTVSGRTGAKLALRRRGSSPSIIQDSAGVRFSKVVGPAKHLLKVLFLNETAI